MTDCQDWLVPVGAIALRILWPCAEPRSNRTLSKLTVERCQCNIPANRVLPCERSSQLDSIVTTEAVIPCQGFRTRHERLRYRNSREVRPLSRKSALSLPDTSELTRSQRRPSVTILAADGALLTTYGDLFGKAQPVQSNPWIPSGRQHRVGRAGKVRQEALELGERVG